MQTREGTHEIKALCMHKDHNVSCMHIEEECWEVVLPAFLSSAVNRPVREYCWQTAGMSQRLSIITSLQLAPICHIKAEEYLM